MRTYVKGREYHLDQALVFLRCRSCLGLIRAVMELGQTVGTVPGRPWEYLRTTLPLICGKCQEDPNE